MFSITVRSIFSREMRADKQNLASVFLFPVRGEAARANVNIFGLFLSLVRGEISRSGASEWIEIDSFLPKVS